MVRMGKKFMILLVAALILVCSPAASTLAEGAAYTYTVRFYSGQQGTFANGQEVITYTGLSYGSVVSFNASSGGVVLKDGSKYYVKGIRESGRDNNTVSASSFVVTSDRDYVVAYGLRGEMVTYTVNYVDASGAALAPSDIYYGNVGDKPVVAFLYIDGYQPQTYNLTKTLMADATQNVFTFVYIPLDGNATDTTVTRTVSRMSRSVVEVIPGDTLLIRKHGEDIVNQNTLLINSIDLDAASRNNRASSDDVGQSLLANPFDMVDLDNGVDLTDPAVPLADMKFKLGPIEVGAKMLLIMIILLVAVAVIAAASWWYWKPYWNRKKENDAEKNAAQPV